MLSLINKVNGVFPHIFIVLMISFVLRFFLALTSSPGGDLSTLIRWGNVLAEKGPVNFYLNEKNEQLSGINSTFWAAAEIYNFSKKNKLPLTEEFIFRLVPIMADFLNAFIIYVLIKKFYKAKVATLVACLYLLNPAVFLMSASLGQPDSYAMLFILLSIYFFIEKKIILTSVIVGIGVAMKPWPLLTIPFYIAYIFFENYKKRSFFEKISKTFVFCSIIIFIILTIFYPYKPYENENLAYHTASRYLTMDRIQPYISKFTLNFWSLIKTYPATDETIFLGISLRMISIIIFSSFFLFVLIQFSVKLLKVQHDNKRIEIFNLITLSLCLAFLAMYLFLTRMLDRYLFFSVNLLYLSLVQLPRFGKALSAVFILANAYNILATSYISSLNWGKSYTEIFSIFNILFFFYLFFYLFKYRINREI